MTAVHFTGPKGNRLRIRRQRGGNLELMDHGHGTGGGAGFPALVALARDSGGIPFLPWLVLVIDDEDSRNTSGTSVRVSGGKATSADLGMSAATPTETELLGGYDRVRRRDEEQIGSGMLLRVREVQLLRYEVRNVRGGGGDFVTPPVFQNERLGGIFGVSRLTFQRRQLSRDHLGSQIEVRPVPGRNAGAKDDRLGRRVHHADPFGDVARKRPTLHHVDQIHRNVTVEPAQRAHLLEGDAAGRTDRAVLVDDGERLGEGGCDIGFAGDLEHAGKLRRKRRKGRTGGR